MKTSSENIDTDQFHDSRMHGFHLVGEESASELHLDIDYITQWPDCDEGDGSTIFGVSKALVKFYDVTDLALSIDWGDSRFTRANSGLYIVEVICEPIETTLRLPAYYRWEIRTNEKRSQVAFGASGMSLELVGEPRFVNRQYLLEAERNPVKQR